MSRERRWRALFGSVSEESSDRERSGIEDGRANAVATVAPLLLATREAAKVLAIGGSTLYEPIAAGEIEGVHIGRSARVPVAALHAFVDRCRASGLR